MNEMPTEGSLPVDNAETTSHAHPTVHHPLRLRREPAGDIVEIRRSSALVGRLAQADVRLTEPEISRRHCRFVLEDGLWRIRDLGSTNGIHLNGHRLQEAVLYPGDRVHIGSVEFIVERATAQRTIRGKREQEQALESIARAVAPN
jgi:pSer/pThr/pTyr-binding forkhead associated (FHA) protein